jgi:hypothetical protein
MTGTNQNNKRAVETILVASGDAALVNDTGAGGALPGGGTRTAATTDLPLMSEVNTGFVNLAEGQLGIFSADANGVRANNVALLSTDTFNEASQIYIAQGTATSQSPGLGAYPLTNNRTYESTGIIMGRNHIVVSGRIAAYDSSSVWNIGQTGAIVPLDETEYAMHVAYKGQILDTENSIHAYEKQTFTYITPDYTTLGLTDELDHIVQNFAYKVNRNSKAFWGGASKWGANEPVVAFAVADIADADTDINNAAFDNGGIVPVFIRNSQVYSINLTPGQVVSLRTAIAPAQGIKTIDITTAGNAAEAKYMTLLALDRDLVYDDRVPQVKIGLDVGLGRGFVTTTSKLETSFAFEGEGIGRHWVIFYENTAGQRKYAQFQRQEWPFVEVPSGINPNEYYNVYVIEHRSLGENGISNISVSPKKAIVLIPTCDDTTAGSFEAILNNWVNSVPSYTKLQDGAGVADIALGELAGYCS